MNSEFRLFTPVLKEFSEFKIGDQIVVRCIHTKWLFGTIAGESKRGIRVWVDDTRAGKSQMICVPFVLVPTHLLKKSELGQTRYMPDQPVVPLQVPFPEGGVKCYIPLVRPVHLSHRSVYYVAEHEDKLHDHARSKECRICHQPVPKDKGFRPWNCKHICHLTCVRYGFKKGLAVRCPTCADSGVERSVEDEDTDEDEDAEYFCQNCGYVGYEFCPICNTSNWSRPTKKGESSISQADDIASRDPPLVESKTTSAVDSSSTERFTRAPRVTNALKPISEHGEGEESQSEPVNSHEDWATPSHPNFRRPSPPKLPRLPSSNSVDDTFKLLKDDFFTRGDSSAQSGTACEPISWITVVENGYNTRNTQKSARKETMAQLHEKLLFDNTADTIR